MGASLPGSPSMAAPWTPLGMEAASQMFHCRISGVIPACSRGWEPRFHGGPPLGLIVLMTWGRAFPVASYSPLRWSSCSTCSVACDEGAHILRTLSVPRATCLLVPDSRCML